MSTHITHSNPPSGGGSIRRQPLEPLLLFLVLLPSATALDSSLSLRTSFLPGNWFEEALLCCRDIELAAMEDNASRGRPFWGVSLGVDGGPATMMAVTSGAGMVQVGTEVPVEAAR
jgi:hypothetical protein